MVIAYKKSKFRMHNLAPIEVILSKKVILRPCIFVDAELHFNILRWNTQDWKDLWRPELAGRISMVDSPREVIGAVLKYMGASYNTNNIDSEVNGGKHAVMQNLESLANQVKIIA